MATGGSLVCKSESWATDDHFVPITLLSPITVAGQAESEFPLVRYKEPRSPANQ